MIIWSADHRLGTIVVVNFPGNLMAVCKPEDHNNKKYLFRKYRFTKRMKVCGGQVFHEQQRRKREKLEHTR